MNIEFDSNNHTHHCTSHMEGDWIIWRCPYCLGYERRLNLRNGKMRVKGNTEFTHQGSSNGITNIAQPLTKNICEN